LGSEQEADQVKRRKGFGVAEKIERATLERMRRAAMT
jgi:hypothetical protein